MVFQKQKIGFKLDLCQEGNLDLLVKITLLLFSAPSQRESVSLVLRSLRPGVPFPGLVPVLTTALAAISFRWFARAHGFPVTPVILPHNLVEPNVLGQTYGIKRRRLSVQGCSAAVRSRR